MITAVFFKDLSLSWSLKGSKQMKSGDKEIRVITEMDQCGWTLCQVLVLFSFSNRSDSPHHTHIHTLYSSLHMPSYDARDVGHSIGGNST